MSDITDKIRKLLELSNSDNEHEAASAAAMAQELMVKYTIEEEEIRGHDPRTQPVEPIESVRLKFYGQTIPAWEASLAGAMSKPFFVRTYRTPGRDITVVGRRSSVEVFKVTWEYVRSEIIRLCNRAWEREREGSRAEGASVADLRARARTWRRSFCLGAVRVVGDRLSENLKRLSAPAPSAVSKSRRVLASARDALAPAKVNALTLTRQTELDEWLKANVKGLRTSYARTAVRRDGYDAGKQAGRTIDVSPRTAKLLGN